jgi:TolB protein
MTNDQRKSLSWLLQGVAGLLVICAAGCVSAPGHFATDAAQDAAPRARPEAVFDATSQAQIAPSLNIFGEFDGVERARTRNGGEAGFQQHTYLDEGFDGDVAVDTKGQWLVFSSTRHSEHADIYLQKVDGLSVTQLTSDEADDAFPVFSPDGKQIAFCSTRNSTWDIYVMDVNGKNTVQITSSPMQEIHPSFSPDGKRLVYSAMSNRSGQWELWTVDLTTNEKRMIGFGLFPTWSPDKSADRIAFQKPRARGSRWFSLWTLDLVDGEACRVTEVAVSSNAAIVSPTWAPDGKRLSFATIVDPVHTEQGRPVGQQDIWVVNLDGTNRHRITDGNGICATPFWAPDGRIYFVSNRGGNDAIWSARAQQTGTATAGTETKELQN